MIHVCVAHRGASGLAPENTMAAFNKAMAFPFVQWIELDVQLSKDGVPVVIHDDTLKRTTNGSGRVADFTAYELKRIDAGSKFGKPYAGEGIPTLEKVLDETIGRCRLNIELKTYGGRYPDLEKRVVDLVHSKGLQYDSVITSFDPEALRKVRKLSGDLRTGLITDVAPASLIQDLKRLDAAFLSLGYSKVTPSLMAAMRAAHVEVMAWTINDIATMKRIGAIDPALMICTNYPDRFEQAFSASV
ncbi:glycerophosphodiester phosphodiesterase [Paenibacillus mendelii]|uniref:Glycerophosphodiester phosphodiesterase n=1 Tax=Paenibacillus mendelii TaxID=206163 RepID=A0ABV6JE74_9BACL|nr:glycerophosphodiester phosphodiesterase family protein [Paenibacillus mendelii]MCQ6558531.1 glycerophosphodiester phosphodiesterase [Paenibacillus mendelii]